MLDAAAMAIVIHSQGIPATKRIPSRISAMIPLHAPEAASGVSFEDAEASGSRSSRRHPAENTKEKASRPNAPATPAQLATKSAPSGGPITRLIRLPN